MLQTLQPNGHAVTVVSTIPIHRCSVCYETTSGCVAGASGFGLGRSGARTVHIDDIAVRSA
jgi:hypothetical protein